MVRGIWQLCFSSRQKTKTKGHNSKSICVGKCKWKREYLKYKIFAAWKCTDASFDKYARYKFVWMRMEKTLRGSLIVP